MSAASATWAVVEVGCLLCTGFYESDPAAIVEAVGAMLDRA